LAVGWLACLDGTGLPFHVRIVSLPLSPFLQFVCGGRGSGWLVNSLNRGAGYVWMVLSWVWLSDKVHVKGGYAVLRFTFLIICMIFLAFPFLYIFPFLLVLSYFFSFLFFFILLFSFSSYGFCTVGGHVSLLLLGSSLIM